MTEILGYHKKKIKKGVIGEFSKIKEEFEELEDAVEQNAKLLVLCELADLVGAIELYLENHNFNITIHDLKLMSDMTRKAFEQGHRSSNQNKKEKK